MVLILVCFQCGLEEVAQLGIRGLGGRLAEVTPGNEPGNLRDQQSEPIRAAVEDERVSVRGEYLDPQISGEIHHRDHLSPEGGHAGDRLRHAGQLGQAIGVEHASGLLDADGEVVVTQPECERASRSEIHAVPVPRWDI